MKRVEYYLADDGTKFDTQWECEQYERECLDFTGLHVYDHEGKPIDLKEKSTERACYLYCETDASAEVFAKLCERDQTLTPWDGSWGSAENASPHSGRWFWDDGTCWVEFSFWKQGWLEEIARKEAVFNGEAKA